jgi:hypothetical protein
MTQSEEVYNKTFDTIKSKYGVEKVTVGHCLSLILELPSGSNERVEAGMTALAFFQKLRRDGKLDLLNEDQTRMFERKIIEESVA